MSRITVLLADDHTIVRESVRKMLKRENNLKVIGEATNGCDAVAMARKLHPDVVLMDIAMPDLDGIRSDRELASDELAHSHAGVPGSKPYGRTIVRLLESFGNSLRVPSLAGIVESKQQMKKGLL